MIISNKLKATASLVEIAHKYNCRPPSTGLSSPLNPITALKDIRNLGTTNLFKK